MSRLESEIKPVFEIAKEEVIRPALSAVPLSLRKQTIAEFDTEIQRESVRERDGARFELRRENTNQNSLEMAECIANARHLMRENEYQLAHSLFRAAVKIDPRNELAIRGLAECARAQNQHEEAITVLKTLAAANASPENLKLLGDELFALEYNQDAVEVYMRALANPKIDESLLFGICKNVGNLLLRLGDPDGAEEYYNKAYTLDPDSDTLLVNFGSLALFRGQLDKALARFREAVSINDQNDKAWVGLAMIHREYGDSDLAWANVEKALDIMPNNESAIKLVAEWAMKDNEVEKAIRRLEAFLRINTEDAQISMWLAKFYYFSSRLESALVEIEKAIYLNPELDGAIEVLSVIRTEIEEREARQK
jgi:tetratricopeptide (TPR) repeat protein